MTTYKRFLLFVSARYYPCGGEADVEGSFDTLGEALAAAAKVNTQYNAVDILDMDARHFVDVPA